MTGTPSDSQVRTQVDGAAPQTSALQASDASAEQSSTPPRPTFGVDPAQPSLDELAVAEGRAVARLARVEGEPHALGGQVVSAPATVPAG